MNVAFICDPEKYRHEDNDIPMTYRAAARDPRIDLFHIPTSEVTGTDDVAVTPIETNDLSHEAFLGLNDEARVMMPVSALDVVFCRTLKPFPHGYLDRLGRWLDYTQFLNNPINKKLQISAGFLSKLAPNFTPDTVVAIDAGDLSAFLARHRVVVAKRPNSTGGLGVFKIWREDRIFKTDHIRHGIRQHESLGDVMDYARGEWDRIELVRYLDRATAGDKRIVVIDGEIYGAYLRRSVSGHWVHNVSNSDSKCTIADITDFERLAIDRTVPLYREYGFHTLGYDFLTNNDGGWLISEINVGNIGGISRLELLTGEPYIARFLTWIIALAKRPAMQCALTSELRV